MIEPTEASGHHFVAAAIVIQDGKVLLCHRHPTRQWYPDVWDLPGGHIESGEHPSAAVARELQEELGIRVDPAHAVELQTLTPTSDLTISIWLVTKWTGEVSNRAPLEHDELGWFSLAEVSQLKLASTEIMALLVRVTEKSQVTIPKNIRDAFGTGAGTGTGTGTEVEFVAEGAAIMVRKMSDGPTRGHQIANRLRGRGDVDMTTDDIMALTRDQ